MLALHVVGQDLELRGRVHERLAGEEQVPVHLPGVGLLRAGAHHHQPVEDAARLAVEDALVELAARAVRLRVVDRRVGVGHPAPVHHEEAVEHALPALALEAHVDVVARRGPPRRTSEWSEKRASRESRAARVATWSDCGALQLQLVAVDEGVVLDHDLGHRVRERGPAVGRGERLHDPALAPAPGHHEGARRGRRWAASSPVETCATRTGSFRTDARGHDHDRAVLGEGRVQVGEDAGPAVRGTAEPRLDAAGLRAQQVAKARHLDARLPGLQRREPGREPPVDEDEVGAAEALARQRLEDGRGRGRGGVGRLEAARASGATGVWRQASSREVGRPFSTNRAIAAVRRSRSQAGSEAAWAEAKRSKLAR